MLEELRADAKAGVLKQVPPWRRPAPEVIADDVEQEVER
jgi:hypothetical protein